MLPARYKLEIHNNSSKDVSLVYENQVLELIESNIILQDEIDKLRSDLNGTREKVYDLQSEVDSLKYALNIINERINDFQSAQNKLITTDEILLFLTNKLEQK